MKRRKTSLINTILRELIIPIRRLAIYRLIARLFGLFFKRKKIELREYTFRKGEHLYITRFDDVEQLARHLLELSVREDSNFNAVDVFRIMTGPPIYVGEDDQKLGTLLGNLDSKALHLFYILGTGNGQKHQ